MADIPERVSAIIMLMRIVKRASVDHDVKLMASDLTP